jgi:nucleolar protein 56
MTIKVFANIAGFFVLDSNDNITSFKPYPKNPEEIAEKIHNLSIYNISEELNKILMDIEEEQIETNSSAVANYARSFGKKCTLDAKSESYQIFVEKIPSILLERETIQSEHEYNQIVKDVSLLLTKKRIAHSSQRIDKNVVHAILSMDDIDKTTNLFSTRIREWYGIHFPEILKEVQTHQTLCKIITNIGIRENINEENIKDYGFTSEKIQKIVRLAKSSMGASFEEKDLIIMQQFAQRTLDLYEERDKLEQWIEREISRVAPNMQSIVGSAIAARLIALAGGLRELAMKPASTVQLLGAEKALFRSLKTGAKPPKHGIIYQMPELHSCSWWQRGNISRAIAGRLTIAARVDAFQGEFIGDQLKIEVDRKIAEIKEKYKEPPEGKKPPVDRSQQPRRRPQGGRPHGRRPQGKKGGKQHYQKRR